MYPNDKQISELYPVASAQANIIRANIDLAFRQLVLDSNIVGKAYQTLSNSIKTCTQNLYFLELEQFASGCQCSEEQINNFLKEQTDEEKIWLYVFLMQKTFASDEIEKCHLYGFIFKSIVIKKLSVENAKRVCRALERSFIEDISNLPKFKNGATDSSELGVSLLNAGLLINTGWDGGNWAGETGGQRFALSPTGELLLNILEENKWKDLKD